MAVPFHQHLFPRVKKLLREFAMVRDGDHIAVGVSGGKDSLTTLYVLASLRRMLPIDFSLTAVTVDMGWPQSDWRGVARFCKELRVGFELIKTEIGPILFDIRQEPNPCSLCSKMRHGALNDTAVRLGCNVVALGHHSNDAIETVLLNMFFNGRIACFQPVTWLDRRRLRLIRPMLYVDEGTIKNVARKLPLPVVHNPCPMDGASKRQHIKELLARQAAQDKEIPKRLLTAVKSLWQSPEQGL